MVRSFYLISRLINNYLTKTNKMKKITTLFILLFSAASIAQSVSVDMTNKYIWRGADFGGFSIQPVFTTPQKYRDYSDFSRCYVFDYRKFYNTSSLSSGLNAIVLAQFLGFTLINLAGFNFDEKDYSVGFDTIRGDVKYTFL